MNRVFLWLSAALITACIACSKDDETQAEQLRNSPEEVQIDGHRLHLETYLWRDTMPMNPQEDEDLRSIVRLTESDSLAMDLADFSLKTQYVLREYVVWEVSVGEIQQNIPYQIEGRSGDGPQWGPDVAVDVVLEFVHEGERYKLLAKDQNIYESL